MVVGALVDHRGETLPDLVEGAEAVVLHLLAIRLVPARRVGVAVAVPLENTCH